MLPPAHTAAARGLGVFFFLRRRDVGSSRFVTQLAVNRMITDGRLRVEYLRERAEEARKKGRDMRDLEARRTMQELAEMYDRLAARTADREQR